MKIVAQHRIIDPERFLTEAEEVVGGAPPGVQLQQSFPSQDTSVAVCLWEADSIDAVREYLDPASEGIAENTYFEVDAEHAIGLPETAAASA
jgi:hypothetical protein